MSPYHPHLLARAVPRYTSYPTAADFGEDVGPEDVGAALARIAPGDIVSLYVHIPFCRDICTYCGCNTGRANRPQRLAFYVEALEQEIDSVAQMLESRARVQRIAFGGGSPNALEPLAFVRLLDRLMLRFATGAPSLSVEIDPRSLGRDWLAAIGAIGIDRISLGVQTFSPRIQQAIGRIQPDTLIERAVEGLRAAGVRSLNFDLMYGLPGQSPDDLAETVMRSIALGADRVALFGYAHLPSLLHRQRGIDASTLPDARMRFEQAALGRSLFLGAGYRPVGFDHFARPDDPLAMAAQDGTLHRNFQGFTDDPAEILIGLGASAISQFPGLIAQNEKESGPYRARIASCALAVRRGVRLTGDMRVRGAVIEALLCHGRAHVSSRLLEASKEALAPFLADGLVRIDGEALIFSDDAWPYARAIAAAFDAFRTASAGQFSHAV